MSDLRRTDIPGKEPRVFRCYGSSLDVLQATMFSELVRGAKVLGIILATLLVVSASSRAADLAGTVTNGTTMKAAAGDDVLLLATSGSTEKEIARAKTDSEGH